MKICKFLSGSNYGEKEIYPIKLCMDLEQNSVCLQQVNIVICCPHPPQPPQKKIEIFQISFSYVWPNFPKLEIKLLKICFKTH